jgi:ribonuclease D
MPKKGPRLSYSQKQKDEFERYNQLRDVLSERLGLEKHMILSRDQIKEIVLTGTYNSLSSWQRKLVLDEIKKKA